MNKFIDDLGGPTFVAEKLGIKRTSVTAWKLREKIPWQHRPALARLATRQAVALPEGFWGVEA